MTTFFIKRLPDYSEETLIAEIRRVANMIKNEKITQTEFDTHSRASHSTIARKFGSWEKALTIAGFGERYGGKIISKKAQEQIGKSATREMCIAEIKRIVGELNTERITHKDFNENSIYSSSVVVKRFGSWDAAVKAAGLLRSYKRNLTESDLFENILAVWTHYGRQPKNSEMNAKPSIISNTTYIERFGGWIKALNAFEEFANSTPLETEENIKIVEDNSNKPDKENSKVKVRDEDKHKISLGLRYRVFSRDRFRCVKCGRSPATELNIQLHVDHIKPFSKEGKTVVDNLQATCQDCNLGKGNRYHQ